MVKYTKYDHGYPTIWSKWMYPPKNVSTFKYIKTAFQGFMTSHKGTFQNNKFFFFASAVGLYISYKISYDWGADSKYNVSLKAEEYSWLYGPADPKEVENRRQHKIMSAPYK